MDAKSRGSLIFISSDSDCDDDFLTLFKPKVIKKKLFFDELEGPVTSYEDMPKEKDNDSSIKKNQDKNPFGSQPFDNMGQTDNKIQTCNFDSSVGALGYVYNSPIANRKTPRRFKPVLLSSDSEEENHGLADIRKNISIDKSIFGERKKKQLDNCAMSVSVKIKDQEFIKKHFSSINLDNADINLSKNIHDKNNLINPFVSTDSKTKARRKHKSVIFSSDNEEEDTHGHTSFLQSLSPTINKENANPEAFEFRKRYKELKSELATKLYLLFNKKIFDNKLPKDLPLEWNRRLTSTAGMFIWTKKNGLEKSSISLSEKLLTSPDRLRDVLLHEMCHAAVVLISQDKKESHGPLWKAYALRCIMVFPYLKLPVTCHKYK